MGSNCTAAVRGEWEIWWLARITFSKRNCSIPHGQVVGKIQELGWKQPLMKLMLIDQETPSEVLFDELKSEKLSWG